MYDGDSNLIMRFEYADARMPVAMTAGGVKYYLAYDQIGTVKAVADASGNVLLKRQYDSFGNILSQESSLPFEVPFGFAGGLYDRDTKLVRFGFRDYDPETGRWTAKDPISFAGGDTDLYGYCLNDPINGIDPLGLYIGQYPPPPPGYNPDTWTARLNSGGKWELYDPDTGQRWLAHPEDETHWRHWDDPDQRGPKKRYPRDSKKKWTNQNKANKKKQQSACDPSGNQPGWTPPIDEFHALDFFGNIVPIDTPVIILPLPRYFPPIMITPEPILVY